MQYGVKMEGQVLNKAVILHCCKCWNPTKERKMDLHSWQVGRKENYILSVDLSEGHTNSVGHTQACEEFPGNNKIVNTQAIIRYCLFFYVKISKQRSGKCELQTQIFSGSLELFSGSFRSFCILFSENRTHQLSESMLNLLLSVIHCSSKTKNAQLRHWLLNLLMICLIIYTAQKKNT